MARAYQLVWFFVFTCWLITPPAIAVEADDLLDWGREVASEIESTLRINRSSLYAETATLSGNQTGGIYGSSFVWPANTQFRMLNSLTQLDPTTYEPVLRAYSDQLRREYWSNGYRSGAGPSDFTTTMDTWWYRWRKPTS
ncbi:hypothetical protein [Aeoliella mucimassa]|uniref:Uncharacterized protein n=1 Tax=Aeoliella mucimassa TaxID=2527972 RepID=A0A518ANN1_9BACT|nr:hypothetical protein [Aeoliella mucimassa]QDU56327.1 hypothetical protein Pan181_25360 [Aeoliella mucimassa]